jgi:hypothetical protein
METATEEQEKVDFDPIYDPFNPELIADPYPAVSIRRHLSRASQATDLLVCARAHSRQG